MVRLLLSGGVDLGLEQAGREDGFRCGSGCWGYENTQLDAQSVYVVPVA
jgi:hypothetical protein